MAIKFNIKYLLAVDNIYLRKHEYCLGIEYCLEMVDLFTVFCIDFTGRSFVKL